MREEEKLAHAVYVALYERWGLPIFPNVTNSEATHTSAVGRLLDRYGIDDPADGLDAGEFANDTLQEMYDTLVAQGSASLEEALRVGAIIEEIDILDLQEQIAQTTAVDVLRVYENLLKGSRNHLRAFASTLLRQTGEAYAPEYLDEDAYEDIVSGSAGDPAWQWRRVQ